MQNEKKRWQRIELWSKSISKGQKAVELFKNVFYCSISNHIFQVEIRLDV